MTAKAFIQVGQRFFAVAHITAIVLDATTGASDYPAVAVYLTDDDTPWTFPHGTPEASALIAYARENADVVALPDYEIK